MNKVLFSSFDKNGSDDWRDWTSVIVTDNCPHEKVRKYFQWGRCLDKEGNPLTYKHYITLDEIDNEYLEALINWTKHGYEDYVHKIFCDEKQWRNKGE